MQILIFANKDDKKTLQQVLNWSNQTHIRFQMTFVTNEKQINQLLYKFNDKLIVVNEPKTARILKKLKKRFLFIKGDWYKGVKYENW